MVKFKLDENIGNRGFALFQNEGHDVATVVSQNLCGTADPNLIKVCHKEKRCLVTLDIEFGNPLSFHPKNYSGIVVLRLSHKPSHQDLLDTIHTLLKGVKEHKDLQKKLWVVQKGKIREYQHEEETKEK